jgi:hypothetical protein
VVEGRHGVGVVARRHLVLPLQLEREGLEAALDLLDARRQIEKHVFSARRI